ncbi:MAG TPA: MFS transporter [Bacteroides sp.]|nr:MFS transporter [Bacteroides sp.]
MFEHMPPALLMTPGRVCILLRYKILSPVEKKQSLNVLLPVFLSFYVMGFVDLVGVATAFVKDDFGLSDTVAQLLPTMVFLWFALISIPTGIFQDRKGKKFTVMLGMAITGLGVILPFIHYSYLTAVLGFMVLGIGNTILQVSANPLLLDVSPKKSQAANLSLSQFVKAIASMLGPVITAALATYTGNWKLIFPIYAAISLISIFWLYSVRVREREPEKEPATFGSVLALFRIPFVTVMILSTFLLVGFDVGMNSNIAIYLQKRFLIPVESASLGISIYFFSLVIGRFLGGVLLRTISTSRFMVASIILTFIGLAGIILSKNLALTRVMIFVAGLGFSNTFPIVFAIIIDRLPRYANELSSLIILSVAGGAVIPPLMGLISDTLGVTASLFMLVICMLYVSFATWYAIRTKPAAMNENQSPDA